MNKSRLAIHRSLFVSLGQAIQTRRKELEISQEELSLKSGVDRAFISEVERGQRNPSIGAVASIAEGLKIKLSLLFTRSEKLMRQADIEKGEEEESPNGNERES